MVSEPIDFYKEDRGEIIVTNPPFSDCKNVFERLAILDKPFIMILPVSKMNTNYFRDWLDDMEAAHPEIQDQIQIIVPRKRIQFIKIENGKRVQMKSCCNFDCYYYCHRMNLPRSIIHLPDEIFAWEKRLVHMMLKIPIQSLGAHGVHNLGYFDLPEIKSMRVLNIAALTRTANCTLPSWRHGFDKLAASA